MRLSTTIKAALIGGGFAIIAALIPYIYNVSIDFYNKKYRTTSDKTLNKIIATSIGKGSIQVPPPGIVRTTFNPNLKGNDFYAQVESDDGRYIVAFADTPNGYENIYFNKLRSGFGWDAKHITIGKRSYLVCYSNTGSGSYLDLSIYSYDGVGKMKEVFHVGELFQGHVYINENTVYVHGNGHKYAVVFRKNKFSLQRYNDKIKPMPDSGTHVLSYVPQGRLLKVMFDGREVKFKPGKKNESDTINIKLDERIIDDDNIVGYPPQYVRILVADGEMDFEPGFFSTIKPVKVGPTSILLSHNYEESYHLNFNVTK